MQGQSRTLPGHALLPCHPPHLFVAAPRPPSLQCTNGALAAEKERMDVLLARQYNLISCVLESGGTAGLAGQEGHTVQEKTLGARRWEHFRLRPGRNWGARKGANAALVAATARVCCLVVVPGANGQPPPPPLGPCPARIEDMRRSIGVADPNSGADELQLVELVGEGTFGKVYKGERRRARGTGSSRGAGRPPSTHLPPPCTASQASGAAPRSRSRPWVRGAMRRGIDARTKPGSASPNSFCVFFRPLLSWRPDPPLLPPHSRPPHTVLPAKMSGAEKRERMAIMEAAISSAMNHPNIVRGRDGVSHARGRRRWMGARVFVRWECGQLYAQQLNAPRCPSALQVQTYTYTIRPTTSINVPAGLE